jgi:bifunctional UDP-N-acetylglucosamine pyrophosphorylase/glucosamine-1-phosphate N-acetyltransferase
VGFTADDPTGYGRIILSEDKMVKSIVEDKDASEEEQKICLVNGGVMAAKAGLLAHFLPRLTSTNTQNEQYLTDIVSLANDKGAQIDVLVTEENELAGVNDRAQLAHVEAIMQSRLRAEAMANGVTLQAPETIFLSADTSFGTDIVIEPHVVIGKDVSIANNSVIRAFSHIEGAIVGKYCVVGPYARLRPGTILQQNVKIGNFVETKNVTFEDSSKANHLSYLGDAEIGQKVNIGAGTITCNYDGVNKLKTTIHDGAFIGSNSALVAPITIGKDALVGAGSVITRDVDDNALGITRSSQKQIKDGASLHQKKAHKKRLET